MNPLLIFNPLAWFLCKRDRQTIELYLLGAMSILVLLTVWYLTISWQISAGLFPSEFQIGSNDPIPSIAQYISEEQLPLWYALAIIILLNVFYIIFFRKDVPLVLMPVICFLSIFGIVVLLRLAPAIGWARQSTLLMNLVTSQVHGIILGFGIMLLLSGALGRKILQLSKIHYRWLLAAMLIAEVMTLLFGIEKNGHKLWLPVGPFSIQTVEFIKIGFVLVLSATMTKQPIDIAHNTTRLFYNKQRLRLIILTCITAAALLTPLALQKDFGPIAQLVLVLSAILLIAGRSWFLAPSVLATMLGLGAISYRLGWTTVVKARLDIWLDPFSNSEQITQAMWVMSSGGWTGVGFGRGFAHSIPVIHSDFIPALIAEEMGLLGIVALLLLYATIARCGLRIAKKNAASPYYASVAVGLTIIPLSQVIMLCAGTAGLLPLTSITLPLINAGGSSLLATYITIGLLISLAKPVIDQHQPFSDNPNTARIP